MSRSCTLALLLCSLTACLLPGASAQSSVDTTSSGDRSGWDAIGGLYALLAQHDALGGHALARKSVRSPSRRLRFGRRSDPDMPPQPPVDELDELMSLRDVRTPVRLRFGRRSDERAVPHIFPQEQVDELSQLDDFLSRDSRTPVRLRFGRRSEEQAVPHIFPKEVQDRSARAPSMRLRFGRRSDTNMFVMPFESAVPKDVKASGVEDDRQQDN